MSELDATFAALSRVLRDHASGLLVKTDAPGHLYIEIPARTPTGKPGFFGAVQIRKSYVSYHLMPVYEDPGLLAGIGDPLLGKMQGKSCFNFKTVDAALFAELAVLTGKCAAAVRARS